MNFAGPSQFVLFVKVIIRVQRNIVGIDVLQLYTQYKYLK